MVKEEKLIKVKALGPYKVASVKKGINYDFKAGQTYEVPETHVTLLVDARVVEVLK